MFIRVVLSMFVAMVCGCTPTVQAQQVKIDPPPTPVVEFARIVRIDKDKSFVVLGVQHTKSEMIAFKKDGKFVETTRHVIYQEPWKIDLSKATVLLSLERGELKKVQGDDLMKRLTPTTTVALVNIDPAKFDPKQLRVVQGNLLVFVTAKRVLSEDDLPKD